MWTMDFPLYIFFFDMDPGFSYLYFLFRYGPWIFLFILSFSTWTLHFPLHFLSQCGTWIFLFVISFSVWTPDFPLYTFFLNMDPGFSSLYVQYFLSRCLECSWGLDMPIFYLLPRNSQIPQENKKKTSRHNVEFFYKSETKILHVNRCKINYYQIDYCIIQKFNTMERFYQPFLHPLYTRGLEIDMTRPGIEPRRPRWEGAL